MLTIHVTRGSSAFCAAVLLSLTFSPVLAKGGGHGGGGRPSFGGGSRAPADKRKLLQDLISTVSTDPVRRWRPALRIAVVEESVEASEEGAAAMAMVAIPTQA